jgi:hypothetical protein
MPTEQQIRGMERSFRGSRSVARVGHVDRCLELPAFGPGRSRNPGSTGIMVPRREASALSRQEATTGPLVRAEPLEQGSPCTIGEPAWGRHRPIARRPWFRWFSPNPRNHPWPAPRTGLADTLIYRPSAVWRKPDSGVTVQPTRQRTVPLPAPLPRPPAGSNKTDDGNRSNVAGCKDQTMVMERGAHGDKMMAARNQGEQVSPGR